MKRSKRTVEFHIILTPPDMPLGPGIGQYRVNLERKMTLDFVPVAGQHFILDGDLPGDKTEVWSPLIRATGGPKGAVGLGFNAEIWHVDKVYYNLFKKRFELYCYPGLDTREQFEAIPKLLCGFYGFHVHYGSRPRRKRKKP